MALVFPQPSSIRSSLASTPAQAKRPALSLAVPKKDAKLRDNPTPAKQRVTLTVPKIDASLRDLTAPEPKEILTSNLPRTLRRFQAAATAEAKVNCRFYCRCGHEMDTDPSTLLGPRLRMTATPGVLADEANGDDPCIHLLQQPALKMSAPSVRKPKERRGTMPALVARRESKMFDW